MKKFFFESWTEWHGEYETITKVFADIPKEATDAIALAEGWDGCHWDAPSVVFTEQVKGTVMSDEAASVIDALKAVDIEECDPDPEDAETA